MTREAMVAELAREIEGKLPPNFDIAAAQRQFPVDYHNSMNTVLVQELVRYVGRCVRLCFIAP